MADGRIIFDGVWKGFQRGERHATLRDLLPAAAKKMFRSPSNASSEKEFWAVQELSFDVGSGDALAIIGPNGAGKSTSLKLATKIMRPDRGRIQIRGRVGALIEIAAGFHPDLTGRENIFLQGAVMGMKRRDIHRRLDEIIAFAGVEKFVDTPVKRYSSGMNARLGFSIAAHLEPDVLLIDEVLSVGDMAFQQRCIERMLQFRRDGVPIVFVSHNLQAVSMLCNQAIYLHGRVLKQGAADDVLKVYVEQSHTSTIAQSAGAVRIEHVELLGADRGDRAGLAPATPLLLRVTYRVMEPTADITLGFLVHRSTDMLVVHDANYTPAELGIRNLTAGQVFRVEYDFLANLTRGHYFLDCHVFHNPTQMFLSRVCPAGTFTIDESRTWQGVAHLNLTARLANVPRERAGVA
jgi:lipopolysaccharide transport system ATP-binding protein